MAVTPSLKELKEILKPMTWKDRAEYLWTYYKIVLAALLGAYQYGSRRLKQWTSTPLKAS